MTDVNIKIHRGSHQIGGCVTEYSCQGWHLFVDYGEELPGGPKSGDLKIEGLTHGDLSKSAMLITHYHGDHIGRITELPEELPIYMGKVGREVQRIFEDHMKRVGEVHQKMLDRLETVNTFEAGKKFAFGPFTIMPITVDHSAFDAYAFKIIAEGVKVFHTGDFRTHGFRSGKFEKLITKFVGKVDYVVCEGTNVRRPDATNEKEHNLQSQLVADFKEHKNNIVYVSSTNIDRLYALYHAALRAGRPFYVDEYQERIMEVAQSDPLWGKSGLYQYDKKYKPMVLQYGNDRGFRMNDRCKDFLEAKGCVLIARPNDRFDGFIERIPGEKQKYLSQWEGYLKEGTEAYNPNLAKSLGKDYLYRHTSGHCDMQSMRKLFSLLHPSEIIPIHTDSPDDFKKLFGHDWNIRLLNDGESILATPEKSAE